MAPTGLAAVAALAAVLIAGGVLIWGAASRRRAADETLKKATTEADRLLRQAERDAESARKEAALEAREKAHEIAAEAERQARERRQEIIGLEQGLADKTRALADRLAATDRVEQELRAREKAIAAHEQRAAGAAARAEQLVADRQRELQRVAGLTADEARDLLLKQIETDARRDAANLVKRLETEARETAADRARQIITDAIQRSAAEHAIETTVSVVDLPSDDLKGRIIGREGRNIRALETATGVELIVDDTPGAIILSSFDPFRREVARQAIERLIADGRIHPARIEEIVEKVKTEMQETVRKEGEAAAFELGLYELDFLRKHGESEPVLNAVAAHHMDIDWPSLEAMIVQAADAISAARPGARRDILESYVKRLEKLEGIADSFEGVSKSFALQAGREIRIVVESERISDEATVWLSKDIARRIENELEYPGQIKVTVIRETRAVEFAR